MIPMKQTECEDLAGKLKMLGWAPVMGKVSSFDETVGYKVGILVKVGDERLKWMEPAQNASSDGVTTQSAHIELINFFATAHAVAKGRPMSTQPVGFTSTMAGTGMVEIAPGPNESLKEFLSKIQKVSEVQVQLGFDFDEVSEPIERISRADDAVSMLKAMGPAPSFTQTAVQVQTELVIEPERQVASMRP